MFLDLDFRFSVRRTYPHDGKSLPTICWRWTLQSPDSSCEQLSLKGGEPA